MWQTVALWPPSEPGSSSVCGCVWGSPWCWRCFRLLSASACCPGRCTCPSGPRRRCTATTKTKKKGMNPVFTDLRKDTVRSYLTCSEPPQAPFRPSWLWTTCGRSWAAAERTLGRPCRATGCNGTARPSARCSAPSGSPVDENRKWWKET